MDADCKSLLRACANGVTFLSIIQITCHPYCVCTGLEISPGLRSSAALENSLTS